MDSEKQLGEDFVKDLRRADAPPPYGSIVDMARQTDAEHMRRILPAYQSHKVVSAARIISYDPAPSPARSDWEILVEVDGRRHKIIVDNLWRQRFDPRPGRYFVLYADGYTSVSPAEPFESGYTRIEGEEQELQREPVLTIIRDGNNFKTVTDEGVMMRLPDGEHHAYVGQAPETEAVPEAILEEARFLAARLREVENEYEDEEFIREFHGHVIPPLARLEALLQDALAPAEPEPETLKALRDRLIREAEKAAHEYAANCDLGDERVAAFEVFENVRTAGAVY